MNIEQPFPLTPGYPITWRGRPPGFVPGETALLYWYLDTNAPPAIELWYNVRVLDLDKLTPRLTAHIDALTPHQQQQWKMNTAQRVDAIARDGGSYTIIELQDRADIGAVNRILEYRRLVAAAWPWLNFTAPMLIYRNIDNDAKLAAAAAAIETLDAPADLYHPSKTETRYTPPIARG